MNNPVQLNAKYSTAIDNKGLWPNIKILPDGCIGAFIYNKPSHGYGCGDVELYISEDSGKNWQFRSQVSEHADNPENVRMNHAVGINANGHLVVIVSGWSEERKPPILKPQICISKDSGFSWERKIWDIDSEYGFIPYGDITIDNEDSLSVAFYAKKTLTDNADFYTVRSLDSGHNWEKPEYALAEHGEVTILKTSEDKWFAVGRDVARKVAYLNQLCAPDPLALLVSDDGRKWQQKSILTLPGQIPGHILELCDGRLLVTYGCRIIGLCGVQAIISSDGGETWSKPEILLSYNGPSDCGYPSTVELSDGTLLTAFYAGDPPHEPEIFGLPLHKNYHMGTLSWTADIFKQENK